MSERWNPILTNEECDATGQLLVEKAHEPGELTKERFLYMILQAHKPGKCSMGEFDRAEICKILTEARKKREVRYCGLLECDHQTCNDKANEQGR